MLEIKNIKVSINDKLYIDDLSLVVNKQDKLAIIGEEGNGKSTLLKIIVGEADYASVSGSVHSLQQTIGYVKQALEEKYFSCGVKEYVFHDDETYYSMINELYPILTTLSLDDSILDKKIGVLSGGEKVKVQFLKVLLDNPSTLLLDEPTNDLDIETLQWLETFISQCDKPIVFISHDETLLHTCANRILHLEQLNKQTKCRHTLFEGSYKEYLASRGRKHAKDIQVAQKEKAQYKQKQERLNNIRNAVHDAQNDTVRNPGLAALLKKKMRNVKSMEKRFEKEGFSHVDSLEEEINIFFPPVSLATKKRIVELHDVPLCIGNHVLCKCIHLEIYGPQHIAIIGKNGCGKTTLLEMIKTYLEDTCELPFGYMPQNYDILWDAQMTPVDFLCPTKEKEEITKIRQWLGSVNFTREEMLAPIASLSGGSKAKLAILSLIYKAYPILVLDEPTRNISPLSNPVIRKALAEYEGCIISVSHDRMYLEEVCDTIYELDEDGLHNLQ